jgi:2'-5' RNA ligase
MSLDSQPRDDAGRFGEKPDVGIARRMTEQLHRLLGHDGTDTPAPSDDLDVDAVLARQEALLNTISDAPSPAPDLVVVADGDDDARLDAQLAALDAAEMTVPDSPAELTGELAGAGAGGGEKSADLDALLDEQLARLEALDSKTTVEHKASEDEDAEVPLFPHEDVDVAEREEKVRKWDPDKHPRDHRGRFATIGSTVSLPESAGGGEGRVIRATGGGNILVRKADGSEVDVPANETEVTRSAAANAAQDSFNARAGQGAGFAAAGQGAAAAPTRAAGQAPSRRKRPSAADAPERGSEPLPPEAVAAVEATRAAARARREADMPDRAAIEAAREARLDSRKPNTGTIPHDVERARLRGHLDSAANLQRNNVTGGVPADAVSAYNQAFNEEETAQATAAARAAAKPKPDKPKRPKGPKPVLTGVAGLVRADPVNGNGMGRAQVEVDTPEGVATITREAPDQFRVSYPGGSKPDRVLALGGRISVIGEPRPVEAAEPSGAGAASFDDGAKVTLPDGTVGTVVGTGPKGVGVRGADGKLTVHPASELTAAADGPNAGKTQAGALKPGDRVTWHDLDGDVTGTVADVQTEGRRATIKFENGDEHNLLTDSLVDVGAAEPPADDYVLDAHPSDLNDEALDNAIATVEAMAQQAEDPLEIEQLDNRYSELTAERDEREQAGDGDLEGYDQPTYSDELDALDPADMTDEQLTDAMDMLQDSGFEGDDPEDPLTQRYAALGAEQQRRAAEPSMIVGPGAALFDDDAIDRSAWTGGKPPNRADGTGTRPDGKPWGSGYANPADPRNDPAYDQYTHELDKKLDETLAEIGDTETIHDKVDGVSGAYRPERQAQHDALLDELMAEFANVPKENKAIVMAGPPGAGKTTVLKTDGSSFGVEMDGGTPVNYAVVNPDDMKEIIVAKGLIPDDYPGRGIGPGESATFLHEESSHLAARLLTRLRAEGHNVILDGTFSGNPDKQAGKVSALREGGYTVTGVLVDGTVDRSLENAARRHRKPPATPGGGYTGRYVPYGLIETNRPTEGAESEVFGRPHRNKASENIERVQQEFDGGVLWYDNSTGASQLVHRVGPGQTVTAGNSEGKSRWIPWEQLRDGVDRSAEVTLEQPKAAGGADRNRGNAERLRRYWVSGAGGQQIRWGTEGDFMRCVGLVSEHMDPERAKGYCNLRHQDAIGKPPGQGHGKKVLEAVGLGDMLPPLEVKAEPATDPAANAEGVANTNPEPTGVMVALYPPDDIASALALETGEAVGDLHVTLAYLGKVEDIGLERVGELVQLVADFANDSYDQDAEIAGIGRWEAGDDGDAFVALVDGPELPDLRADLVDALAAAGFTVASDHGFTPHVTLAYLDPAAQSPLERLEALPATFEFLSVAVGPEVWDFPLNADAEQAPADAPA